MPREIRWIPFTWPALSVATSRERNIWLLLIFSVLWSKTLILSLASPTTSVNPSSATTTEKIWLKRKLNKSSKNASRSFTTEIVVLSTSKKKYFFGKTNSFKGFNSLLLMKVVLELKNLTELKLSGIINWPEKEPMKRSTINKRVGSDRRFSLGRSPIL